jgi:hypothetical protein
VKFYGELKASEVIGARVINGEDINVLGFPQLKIENSITAGELLEKCAVQIVFLDSFDQIAPGSLEVINFKLEINQTKIEFAERNSFPCLNKISSKTLLGLEFLVASRTTYSLYQENYFPNRTGIVLNPIEFSVLLRKCQRGEQFNLETLKCITCEANFYSFAEEFLEPSSCKSCLQENFFCYGGFQITPKPGYWRNGYDSTNILKCLNPSGKE